MEKGNKNKEFEVYLHANFFVDSDNPQIIEFALSNVKKEASDIEKAVSLYYAIRDGFRYNPYKVAGTPEEYKASSVLERGKVHGGHCIDKAVLLAACARVVGIPSRMHFTNVKNHISTEKLEKELGTSLLVFHGYTELYLDDKWIAATPAFNKELCEHLNVDPLEFDGKESSVFQQYDREGGKFMEYIHDYGTYPDIPFQKMVGEWKKHYSDFIKRLKDGQADLKDFDWDLDRL
jgi:transglutaminase-like putative cysteine protease